MARDDATGLRPRREHGALVAGPIDGVQLTRRGAGKIKNLGTVIGWTT